LGESYLDKIKLFCIPYAGGSAMNYMTWKKLLDNRIQIMPLELAGRGSRINEPLYNNTEEAINDIYNVIYKELDGTPYAIFGHSMGTMLTYELLRKITAKMHQEPVHVFFSGRYPPYINAEDKFTHLLPDEEFLAEISELGGMDQEVLQCQELISIFLPVLGQIISLWKHINIR
jgi:surfactin synthase thioesterase subunit